MDSDILRDDSLVPDNSFLLQGIQCPYCGGTDVRLTTLHMDRGGAVRTFACRTCYRPWTVESGTESSDDLAGPVWDAADPNSNGAGDIPFPGA
jgi:transposase-like protein